MIKNLENSSIDQAISLYNSSVALSRSLNTARSYRNALNAFRIVLEDRSLIPEETPISKLPEDAVSWFAQSLKLNSPATEQLYLTAVAGFYEFLSAEQLAEPNLPRIRLLIRQRARKPGQRLPQFPQNDIELTIDYAINLADQAYEITQRSIDPYARSSLHIGTG